jgi:hypothetical protein
MDRTSGLYIQPSGHTDVHVQTDRETQWMDQVNEVVAAHTLAHVVHTRTPLRCGWTVVGTCMHTCLCMHACLSLSFSFGENTVVFMLH